MNSEEEICRVCRCEGTEDSPLFHPCKCTGSIRYVHQECLVEWLAHSKKKHCELCKSQFRFTKIYSDTMPQSIPFFVLCKKVIVTMQKKLFFISRVLLALFCWTVLLPLILQYVWSLNLKLGDAYTFASANTTSIRDKNTPGYFESISAITSVPRLNMLIASTAQGQVLTFSVTFVLITAFLVREWVLQNAVHVVDELQGQQFNDLDENNQAAARNMREVQEARQRLAVVMDHLRERQLQRNEELQRNGRIEELDRARRRFALLENNIRDAANTMVNVPDGNGDDDLPEGDRFPRVNPFAPQRPQNGIDSMGYNRIQPIPGSGPRSQASSMNLNEANNDNLNVAADDSATSSPALSDSGNEDNHSPELPESIREVQPEPANVDDNHDIGAEAVRNAVLEAQNQAVADEDVNAAARAAQIAHADDADDFDGIFEFLGLRGPVLGFLQNCFVIAFVVSIFLTIVIGVPYMTGRVFVEWTLFFVQRPTVILKFCWVILGTISDWTLGGLFNLSKILLRLPGISSVGKSFGISSFFDMSYDQVIQNCTTFFHDKFYSSLSNFNGILTFHLDTVQKKFIETFSLFPVFRVSHMFAKLLKSFVQNYSTRPVDRVFTLMVGYSLFSSLGVSYLNRKQFLFKDPQIRNVELAFREGLRQCGSIVKFTIIFSIELVVFPIFCGILLSLCVIGTFKNMTFETLCSVMSDHPFPGTFFAWFIGITFMFEFAVFISMIRKIVRPGVLFFLRDPNDPQFHPIREILEKPMLLQLKKIGFSAILYFSFILGCVGSVIHILKMTGMVFPLRFTTKPVVFEAPIDLLALQALIHVSIKLFKPMDLMRFVWRSLISFLCRGLRLSSYVMGERYKDEEGYHPSKNLSFIRRLFSKPPSVGIETDPEDEKVNEKDSEDVLVFDGCFLRCPSKDVVPVHSGAMLIPITKDGYRLPEKKEKIEDNPDYTTAYAPPYFYKRLIALLFFCWLVSVITTVSLVFFPLSIGRVLFKALFPSTFEHDFYTYIIGFCALVFPMYSVYYVTKHTDSIQRVSEYAKLETLRRFLTKYVKWGTLYLFTIVVLPILTGVVWELYVFIPFRMLFSKGSLTVDALQSWIIGVFVVRILYYFASSNEDRALTRALREARRDPNDPQIRELMTKYVLPFTSGLILAITFPSLLTYLTYPFLSSVLPMFSKTEFYRMMHPTFLGFAVLAVICRRLSELSSKWSQGIRDEMYMVGTRLHNYDDHESSRATVSEH
ncbi:ER-localized ubiquitin ligase Doa10 [Schizosaccharomyces octosporus yFS286]|uniref:RING-type E3 ubiquitin transferase n=1 Tax=Schizosaccharomyces octosporus (strain yFS286) TaxID=483514 RepID=S9R474_SCHOY|nr:ER-localized ubiquitin ligase Doa10 [Schizosaccharomyces octosporus yFS286]EPX73135.1 ER-localized ubiquitin ligase Doa10 [Schizosaccharomyces octosporus yFS286]